MNKIFAWMKAHPYLTGAIVIVGGLAVYLVLSRGGGGVSYVQGGATGPSDAQVAAQAQLNMAQLAANAQIQSYQASINMAQIQGQTDIALADRTLEATLASITAQMGISNQQTAAQRDIALAQTQAQVQMSGQQADTMKLMMLAMAKPKTIKQLAKTGILGSSVPTSIPTNISIVVPTLPNPTNGGVLP